MSANFFPDLSGLCNPVLRANVGCGYEVGCSGDYLVRVENLDDPDDFVETLAPESYDGEGSVVAIDLAPFVDENVVFGSPRITATEWVTRPGAAARASPVARRPHPS